MLPNPSATTAKIVAIVNQKGGVGKTTTAINVGAALVQEGFRVLIVDLDPQGNASTGLGIDTKNREKTSYDLLLEGVKLPDVVSPTTTRGLSVVPATADLSSADIQMFANKQHSFLLRAGLTSDEAKTMAFDYILIDCPPSLSLLTINAMVAANSVLVPLQSEFFALEGLSQLMLTIREIRQSANPGLRIEGIALTMFDGRNRLAQQVLADARETLGDLVFQTVIPRNVRVSEAPSFAKPVTEYDSTSKGSIAYRALAQEIMARNSVGRQRA